ncbi:MAG: hypothetical protein LBU32_31910 [Clostridiales bacterium]|nr:hypothetical protein [Clostridiales bacterium]
MFESITGNALLQAARIQPGTVRLGEGGGAGKALAPPENGGQRRSWQARRGAADLPASPESANSSAFPFKPRATPAHPGPPPLISRACSRAMPASSGIGASSSASVGTPSPIS